MRQEQLRNEIREVFSGSIVIHFFPVLWQGWESDEVGAVVQQDGRRFLVVTDHGRAVKCTQDRLTSKIEEYERAIRETRAAIELLKP